MAAGDTQITIAGNLVDDPELRFTPSGQPVAKFRVASTPRFLDKNTNEWKDGDSLFLTCNVWRQAAENVAESLQRGMRVIVSPNDAAPVEFSFWRVCQVDWKTSRERSSKRTK